ncbi:MAG: Crp/Fnr family transcriptional regulator [Candidatus Kapabacteria bacterium]|nr:Crp/Fnr family transcriptional regulator [Candidatus Kapabacteria bacterium]MCS7169536.1 Crp/Fnr family transcriptional regulator [Candidatus Kapabacteria bacterium]MDW7997101.1 Crp/Fnr family transcriptional regulator [Bacteroidota bacterium]MDW8224942.1 Crp/Fnr family transcriptional regulator [Bacteroidota bacterium]
MGLREQLRICSQCPYGWLNPLGELGGEAQHALARERRIEIFPARATIVRFGEPVTTLYCISRGTAKAVLPYHEGKQQIEVLIGLHKPGDILGLRDLFGERRHTVTVTSMEELQACALPAEIVERLARQHSQFWVRVAQLLAREIEAVEEQLLLFQRRSIRERVVHLLLLLLRTYGADEHGYIRFPVTPASLAELLRTSVSAVRRTLGTLERRRLIRSISDRVGISDAKALAHLLQHT